MPVEIKELIIRAVVTDDRDANAHAATATTTTDPDRDALVQECVRQVLKILEHARER